TRRRTGRIVHDDAGDGTVVLCRERLDDEGTRTAVDDRDVTVDRAAVDERRAGIRIGRDAVVGQYEVTRDAVRGRTKVRGAGAVGRRQRTAGVDPHRRGADEHERRVSRHAGTGPHDVVGIDR